MTTTNTMDTDATVKQSIKIIKAGSDYELPRSNRLYDFTHIEDGLEALMLLGIHGNNKKSQGF